MRKDVTQADKAENAHADTEVSQPGHDVGLNIFPFPAGIIFGLVEDLPQQHQIRGNGDDRNDLDNGF